MTNIFDDASEVFIGRKVVKSIKIGNNILYEETVTNLQVTDVTVTLVYKDTGRRNPYRWVGLYQNNTLVDEVSSAPNGEYVFHDVQYGDYSFHVGSSAAFDTHNVTIDATHTSFQYQSGREND